MPATPIYIICSPRPQVGKTLLARLLSEFLLLEERQGDGVRHQPERAVAARLSPATSPKQPTSSDTYGKMQLMDRVIVDDGLSQGDRPRLSRLRRVLQDVGADRLPEGSGATQCGADRPVRRRHRPHLGARIRDAEAADPAVEPDRDRQRICGARRIARRDVARPRLRVTALPTFLKTYVDRLAFSFTGYLRQEKDSSTELHQWIRRNYYAFRELELKLILQGS